MSGWLTSTAGKLLKFIARAGQRNSKHPPKRKPVTPVDSDSFSVGIHFEALEPRILLSGSGEAGVADNALQNAQSSSKNAIEMESFAFHEQSYRSGTDALTQINNPEVSGSDFPANSVPDTAQESFTTGDLSISNSIPETTATPSTSELLANDSNRDNVDTLTALDALPQDVSESEARRELVLVDAGAADHQQLVDDLLANQDPNRHIDVFVLDSDRDGVAQISELLSEYRDIDAVHVLSHGTDWGIRLGTSWLHSENLGQYADDIAGWKEALAEDADLLIYGCNLASGESGQALIQSLVDLTGADVAASVDNTGHASLGGDWNLEFVHGPIETDSVFSANLHQNWIGLLSVIPNSLLVSTSDNVTSSGAPGLADWNEDEVIALSGPDFSLGPHPDTDGEFSMEFNIGQFGNSKNINALHYMRSSFTVGSGGPTTEFTLEEGDLLLSVNGNSPYTYTGNTTSITIHQSDVFVFRPQALGDYTGGEFYYLLDDPVGLRIRGVSLVEAASVTVGDGPALTQGTFLLSVDDNISPHDERDRVYTYLPTTIGDTTTSGAAPQILIEGDDSGNLTFTSDVQGIHIVDEAGIYGGVSLNAGDLLLTLDDDEINVGNIGLSVDRQDIVRLQMSETRQGPNNRSTGTAEILFDGSSVGLDSIQEDLNALTLVPPSTTVVNTNDSGPGSLRQAILSANSMSGIDTIDFDIPGSGPHTISLSTALPAITDTVILDATTQPGFSGTPIIELNGFSAGPGNGLTLDAGSDGSTIRGLVINRFDDHGILILSDDNRIETNYIGTNVAGDAVLGNTEDGISIESGASNNTIGGSTAAKRNIISGNDDGIAVKGTNTSFNVIQGNYIGTDVSGTVDLGNLDDGIVIYNDASDITVGGNAAGEGNIISGNDSDGIQIGSSSSATSNLTIQGNLIGTDVTGALALPNLQSGIDLEDGQNILIGGTAGEGNTIAFNGEIGIEADPNATNTSLLGNSIFANTLLGIDWGPDNVTTNDSPEVDGVQNYPVLTSAVAYDLNTITIDGTIHSTGGTTFRIEFFASSVEDVSGYGEGETYLGFTTVTTDGAGDATFSTSLSATVSAGQFITATATVDPGGNTSEFAQNISAIAGNDAPVNIVPGPQSTNEDTPLVFSSGSLN